jgi:hypothetical protein
MIALITLTVAGADTGPFNLYSDVDGFSSAFETNIDKATLLAGYTSYVVPDGTTDIRAMSMGICTNYSELTLLDLRWRALATECEQASNFEITHEVTDYVTPGATYYDNTTNRVYVADHQDYIRGNISWFDPFTATTASDATYYTGIQFDSLYSLYVDTVYRRIYLTGTSVQTVPNTGLISYDIDTNTHQVYPYGIDTPFSRISLFVTTNSIIVGGAYSGATVGFGVLDRATPTSVTFVAYDNTGGNFHNVTNAMNVIEVGDKYWIVAGPGAYTGGVGSPSGNILVFNQDLTYNSTITLTGTAPYAGGGGSYWQFGFYDEFYNTFYLSDIGSNNIFRFTVNSTFTGAVGPISSENQSVRFNSLANTNMVVYYTIDPVSEKLYAGCQVIGGTTGNKTYEIDRATGAYVRWIDDVFVYKIAPVADSFGTDSLMAPDGGAAPWGTVNPARDGKVTFFNNSVNSYNTGMVDVVTLEQYNFATGINTGLTKPNVLGDPDYIPPYEDLTECPLTYNLICPTVGFNIPTLTTAYYEFNLDERTNSNPLLAYVKVVLYNTITSATVEFVDIPTPMTYVYYNASFTGLTLPNNTDYAIKVEYYDSSDTLLICETP